MKQMYPNNSTVTYKIGKNINKTGKIISFDSNMGLYLIQLDNIKPGLAVGATQWIAQEDVLNNVIIAVDRLVTV